MGEDWSREEVEATVADYFNMLYQERQGLKYNKTEHRHRLAALLNNRSDGSIERKHQNISAVLGALHFPSIDGYKPLSNYQRLLYEIVSSQLEANGNLKELIKDQVNQPTGIPKIKDILLALVDVPTLPLEKHNLMIGVRELVSTFKTDYLAQESRNRSLGIAGEEFIIQFEQARLIRAGKENLASKIKHISVTEGDSAGFDILSFETTGQERFVEVKTTAYGPYTPFFVTKNELEVSNRNALGYYLYRSFNFRRQPKLFTKHGSLDQVFKLEPTQYLAKLG